MSCWLKALRQGSLQDLSGRGVLNLLNSQIWSILWNQAKQFAFLYKSYLTSISLAIEFNNSIAIVKPEIKTRTKPKKSVKKVDFSSHRVNWVLFEFSATLVITLSSHLSSLFTYLYYCCFVMRVTLCQKWTETLGALMYREPYLKPKGYKLCQRYRRYLPKHMLIFSFHEAKVIFKPWTCVIPNKAPGWATRRVTTWSLPAFFTCLQHCCRVYVASSIHMGKFSIGRR